MRQYKIIHQRLGDVICFQEGDTLRSFTMDDLANPDYQQYLEWLAAGNTPEEWNPDGSV